MFNYLILVLNVLQIKSMKTKQKRLHRSGAIFK